MKIWEWINGADYNLIRYENSTLEYRKINKKIGIKRLKPLRCSDMLFVPKVETLGCLYCATDSNGNPFASLINKSMVTKVLVAKDCSV